MKITETQGDRDTPASSSLEAHDFLRYGYHFEFFHAVAALERLDPSAPGVGGAGPYSREVVRFRHDPSLGFPTADVSHVEQVEREDGGRRFEITTTFLGLTGAVSPLPLYLAEELAQNQDSEPIARDFLDIFHHRLVSFVYRVGVKYDIAQGFDRRGTDAWSRRILALCGFDLAGSDTPRALPLWRLLRLAPLLVMGVRSARVLELAIAEVCGGALDGASVEVEQFAGGWTSLDAGAKMQLGTSNHALGRTAILGSECYDRAGRVVIHIGPLGVEFRRLLPDGDLYTVVCEVLGRFCPPAIEVGLDLALDPAARPVFRLGDAAASRLASDAWLAGSSAAAAGVRVDLGVVGSNGNASPPT